MCLYFVGRTVGRCLYIGVPVGTVGVSVGRCVSIGVYRLMCL